MNAPDALAGRRAKCPKCSNIIDVPALDDEPAPVAAAPAPERKAPRGRGADGDDQRDDGDGSGKGSKKPAKKSNTMMFVLIGVGAAVLLFCCITPGGIFGVLYFMGKSANEAAEAEKKEVADTKDPLKVNADTLAKDYATPAAGDAKYKDKVIEISGTVFSVTDTVTIISGMGVMIECRLADSLGQIQKYTNGQQVKFKGKFKGQGLGGMGFEVTSAMEVK
jgi:hypothetical protein